MNGITEEDFLDLIYEELEGGRLLLPTLPEIALRIRDILEDPDSSLADASDVIGRDAALSARLLQVTNSALLRGRSPIDNLRTAVNRLGAERIRTLVVGMAMEQMFQATSDVVDRRLRAAWTHSVETAALAQALAGAHTSLQPDRAMLAGLLHDIGLLPVLRRAEDYPELLQQEAVLERILAQSHGDIGAVVLRKWGYADDFVAVALEHENFAYDPAPAPDYIDVVIVANLQSDGPGEAWLEAVDWSRVPAFIKLGLTGDRQAIDRDNIDLGIFGTPED